MLTFLHIPVANMTLDSYEPIAQLGNTIYTAAAVLEVIGDVEVIQPSSVSRRRRDDHHHDDHHDDHHHMHFHHDGGCVQYSDSLNAGFSGSSSSSHPASHSSCSAFSKPRDGFAYSADVTVGDHHSHKKDHCLFDVKGDPEMSLCFHDNKLTFKLHEHHPHPGHGGHPSSPHGAPGGHHDHEHEHHKLEMEVNFNPQPGTQYNIAVSYRYSLKSHFFSPNAFKQLHELQ